MSSSLFLKNTRTQNTQLGLCVPVAFKCTTGRMRNLARTWQCKYKILIACRFFLLHSAFTFLTQLKEGRCNFVDWQFETHRNVFFLGFLFCG